MARKNGPHWLVWLVVLAAVAAGTVYLARRERSGTGEPKYRTEIVDRGDVTLTVTATGAISAVTTVQVGSQVSGIIARLYADFNSRVTRGQLLAELDPTPFEAQAAQRRADVLQNEVHMRNAEISFRRQDRLLAEGLAPQSDFDAAKATYEAAEAQVEQSLAALQQAETNLKYTRILSPIDGVVVARQYDVGQTVAASFQAPTLFTIAQDLTKMQVQADVDQSDIGRIKIGQTARFTVDAYPEQEFKAHISQIRLNATVNQNVITYPVILEVANPEGKLRPQMTANVTVEVSTVKDVLRLPNAALRFRPPQSTEEDGGRGGPRAAGATGSPGPGTEQRAAQLAEKRPGITGAAVMLEAARQGRSGKGMQTVHLLLGNGELRPVQVRTGISDGRYTEIVEGDLKPGDKVVVGSATVKVETTGRMPGGGRPF